MFILQNRGAKVLFFLQIAKYFHVFLPMFSKITKITKIRRLLYSIYKTVDVSDV